jgi:hypothetical protein
VRSREIGQPKTSRQFLRRARICSTVELPLVMA